MFRVSYSLLLRSFYSTTDANAIAYTGSMHVISEGQARRLLGFQDAETRQSLLDVGAGDGAVTLHLSALFHEVHCTETSPYMVRRLRERGFTCTETSNPCDAMGGPFDVVSCLNVLDRCSAPYSVSSFAYRLIDFLRHGMLKVLAAVITTASLNVETHHRSIAVSRGASISSVRFSHPNCLQMVAMAFCSLTIWLVLLNQGNRGRPQVNVFLDLCFNQSLKKL